jgi:hypothetical protein
MISPFNRFRAWRLAPPLVLAVTLLFSSIDAESQTGQQLPAWLTAEERRSIEKERGEKDRIEVLLKVSGSRLGNARTQLDAQEFEKTSNEVSNYGVLIAYTAQFIESLQKKEKDKKKLYKMVELVLRKDLNVLESMRYELPQKYADEVANVYEQVRKFRETALGAVFGKDFFPVTELEDDNNPSEKPLKEK